MRSLHLANESTLCNNRYSKIKMICTICPMFHTINTHQYWDGNGATYLIQLKVITHSNIFQNSNTDNSLNIFLPLLSSTVKIKLNPVKPFGYIPIGLHSWGSDSLSVTVICLKDPVRVKVEVVGSNDMVTPHSLSLFCFRSKQAAKAHPTAWLNLSPWGEV